MEETDNSPNNLGIRVSILQPSQVLDTQDNLEEPEGARGSIGFRQQCRSVKQVIANIEAVYQQEKGQNLIALFYVKTCNKIDMVVVGLVLEKYDDSTQS